MHATHPRVLTIVALACTASLYGTLLAGTENATASNTDAADAGAACVPGKLDAGPLTRMSPTASWVSWPALVGDSSGGLSTAFQVQQTAPRGETTASLWSADLPASPGDPRLIRAGGPDWPAMSDPDLIRNLGVDAAGIQTFAFVEEDIPVDGPSSEDWNVWVATRAPGSAWSSPTRVNVSSAYLGEVRLAVNSSGAAVVTWNQSLHRLWAAYRPASDAPWLPATRLSRRDGYHHQVGIDDAGNATVAYNGMSGSAAWTRRYEPATGWGAADRLSRDDRAWGTQLAVSPSGVATATWSEQLPGRQADGHFIRRMTGDGRWEGRERRRGAAIWDNGLAMDARGVTLVAWFNDRREVIARFSRPDGTWRRRVVLTGSQRNHPWWPLAVAMNRRGDTLVVWKAGTSRGPALRGRYRARGQAWAPTQRLSPVGVNPDIYTSTVTLTGDAGVAWLRRRAVEARQLAVCR